MQKRTEIYSTIKTLKDTDQEVIFIFYCLFGMDRQVLLDCLQT